MMVNKHEDIYRSILYLKHIDIGTLRYIQTSNEMHLKALSSAYVCAHAHTVCTQYLHLIEHICLLGLGLHRLFPFVLILPMNYLIVVFANTLAA